MNIPDFSNQTFLNKEANANLAGIGARILRNAVKKPKQQGQMITDPAKIKSLDPTKVRNLSDDEILEMRKSQLLEDGTGSIVLDAPLGLFKMLSPKSWGDKLDDWIARGKLKMESWDTKAGAKLSGNNPNSLRGKLFSVQRGREGKGDIVAEYANDDGTISYLTQGGVGDRRSSVLAPVSNTIKVGTPLLASAFIAEKLLPKPGEQNASSNPQAPNVSNVPGPGYTSPYVSQQRTALFQDEHFEKTAQKLHTNQDPNDIIEESIWSSLEKQASFNKIAQLEKSIEKMAAFVEDLKQENQLLSKIASEEKIAHEKTAKEFSDLKQTFFSKQAEAEEFRLRTVARERSKHVLKMAETMLEKGLIKQAEFDQQVDKLMSCDETTLNLYSNMVKQATSNDETLESLSVLSEYNSMDSKGTPERHGRGINKAGQTIGEAARYLLEKQN